MTEVKKKIKIYQIKQEEEMDIIPKNIEELKNFISVKFDGINNNSKNFDLYFLDKDKDKIIMEDSEDFFKSQIDTILKDDNPQIYIKFKNENKDTLKENKNISNEKFGEQNMSKIEDEENPKKNIKSNFSINYEEDNDNNNDNDNIEKELLKKEQKIKEMKSIIKKLSGEINTNKDKNSKLNENKESLNDFYEKKIESQKEIINNQMELINKFHKNELELNNEIEKNKKEIELLNVQIKALQITKEKDIDDITEELNNTKEQLKKEKEKQNAENNKNYQQEIKRLENENKEINNKLNRLNKERKGLIFNLN